MESNLISLLLLFFAILSVSSNSHLPNDELGPVEHEIQAALATITANQTQQKGYPIPANCPGKATNSCTYILHLNDASPDWASVAQILDGACALIGTANLTWDATLQWTAVNTTGDGALPLPVRVSIQNWSRRGAAYRVRYGDGEWYNAIAATVAEQSYGAAFTCNATTGLGTHYMAGRDKIAWMSGAAARKEMHWLEQAYRLAVAGFVIYMAGDWV